MLKIIFYNDSEAIEDSLLKYAVIASQYKSKWIFCKHRDRDTWEIPGGRREKNEDILATAKRELFEETGAVDFNLEPICPYSVETKAEKSYGFLCYASIEKLAELPHSEIESIDFFFDMPDNMTYPDIQPKLLAKVREVKGLKLA